MRFDSKFDLGQKVWHIRQDFKEEFIACPSCVGGQVPLPDGTKLKCPRCKEHGLIALRNRHRWYVSGEMRIGQVRVCVGGKEDEREEYMCHETGVGSGSVWKADYFFTSAEQAQVECDKRNNDLAIDWVCAECFPQFQPVKYSFQEKRYCSIHGNYTSFVERDKANTLLEARKQKEEPGA